MEPIDLQWPWPDLGPLAIRAVQTECRVRNIMQSDYDCDQETLDAHIDAAVDARETLLKGLADHGINPSLARSLAKVLERIDYDTQEQGLVGKADPVGPQQF